MNLNELDIEHHFIANEVYSKRTVIPKNVTLTQHIHTYDHASALVEGKVLVEVGGVYTEYEAPAMIIIAAGKQHSVTALTDTVWHCIHISRVTNTNRVDETLIAETSE